MPIIFAKKKLELIIKGTTQQADDIINELKMELEQAKAKIQAFEKWLALGTPFESAQFDHQKVLKEYRKLFASFITGEAEARERT
jgi:lysine/ornithine N-monooxygenase